MASAAGRRGEIFRLPLAGQEWVPLTVPAGR
jgi:hypothetical protein